MLNATSHIELEFFDKISELVKVQNSCTRGSRYITPRALGMTSLSCEEAGNVSISAMQSTVSSNWLCCKGTVALSTFADWATFLLRSPQAPNATWFSAKISFARQYKMSVCGKVERCSRQNFFSAEKHCLKGRQTAFFDTFLFTIRLVLGETH